jgi:hypothetical protein
MAMSRAAIDLRGTGSGCRRSDLQRLLENLQNGWMFYGRLMASSAMRASRVVGRRNQPRRQVGDERLEVEPTRQVRRALSQTPEARR